MNMFRITKMITVGDLGEFVQLVNSIGGSFIERETRIDGEHWLMCIACDNRNQAAVIRCWASRAADPASRCGFEEVGSEGGR